MDSDFLIGGTSAAALITIIVQLAKMYGLDSKAAPLLAILFGVLFGVLAELEAPTEAPMIGRWVGAIIKGFMVGAGSIGLYALIKSTQGKVEERKAQEAVEAGNVVEAEVVSQPPGTSLLPTTNPLGEGDTALRVSNPNTPQSGPIGGNEP